MRRWAVGLLFYGGRGCREESGSVRITDAVASMDKAAEMGKDCIFAVGNAPTALVRLYELIQEGKIHPKLIIGVPVGFVNVVTVQGIDYILAGHSLYCGKEAERAAAM